jgi:hypothetical protein
MYMNADSTTKADLMQLSARQKELAQMTLRAQATKKTAKKSAGAVEELPGITAPWGFWDPFQFSVGTSEGELLYFREAELKHGRVCMVSALGLFVGERFHPLFGGELDGPALSGGTFAGTGPFWLAIIAATGGIEAITSNGRWQATEGASFTPELSEGVIPGDLGFDPLNLKPKEADKFLEIQNKELLNGRLAMISSLGMLVEELVSGEKLHGLSVNLGLDS